MFLMELEADTHTYGILRHHLMPQARERKERGNTNSVPVPFYRRSSGKPAANRHFELDWFNTHS